MHSLSVIILNFNTFDLTCRCISSVYESNKSINDLEIIVIDNGSDEVSDLEFVDVFPEIIYHKSEKNIGFAKANNLGLKLASKKYVLLLNSDVLIKNQDTLYRCLNKIDDFVFPVVLSPLLYNENGDCQISFGALPSIVREILRSLFIEKCIPKHLKKKYLLQFTGDEERLIRKGWLVATCLFFERGLLKLLPKGKLYDNTFLYGEELFWGYYWYKSDVMQYSYNQESVIHLVAQSSKVNKDFSIERRRAYQIYGEYLFLKFRYGNFLTWILYFIRFLRLSILSLYDIKLKMNRRLIIDLLLSRFTEKYPFVMNK